MTTWYLHWVREDQQGDFEMGTFETREAAEAAIPAARLELLDQSQGNLPEDAEHRAEIDAGSWSISWDLDEMIEALEEKFGEGNVKIVEGAEIHVYGEMPNANHIEDWWFFGNLRDSDIEERIGQLANN